MKIAIAGGTGKEGRALAVRWARAGHEVSVGSRDKDRAVAAAAELGHGITGGDNATVIAAAEAVVLSVPYSAHADTLKGLVDAVAGKVLVDITVPLQPPAVRVVHLPAGGSAALETKAIVGPSVSVVAAIHHISNVHLGDAEHAFDCDALFCAEDDRGRAVARTLITDLGLFPIDAGPLANAVALEALTPVLLHINKTYKIPAAGIRITGIPR